MNPGYSTFGFPGSSVTLGKCHGYYDLDGYSRSRAEFWLSRPASAPKQRPKQRQKGGWRDEVVVFSNDGTAPFDSGEGRGRAHRNLRSYFDRPLPPAGCGKERS